MPAVLGAHAWMRPLSQSRPGAKCLALRIGTFSSPSMSPDAGSASSPSVTRTIISRSSSGCAAIAPERDPAFGYLEGPGPARSTRFHVQVPGRANWVFKRVFSRAAALGFRGLGDRRTVDARE